MCTYLPDECLVNSQVKEIESIVAPSAFPKPAAHLPSLHGRGRGIPNGT